MASDTLVLCYHGVSSDWPSELAVAPEALERQVAGLLARGYVGVPFTEVLDPGGPDLRLAVTFDDAYTSVHDHALPVLSSLGVVATVFAVTDHVGSPRPMSWPGIEEWASGSHAGEVCSMSWEQFEAVLEAGWEVGSHTCSHPHLTGCTDERLADELVCSREALARRLGACASIAYPYGDVDLRVAAAASYAGYTAGAALPRRIRRATPLAWPRVGVYRGDDGRYYRLKVSRGVRWVRAVMPGGRLTVGRSAAPGS